MVAVSEDEVEPGLVVYLDPEALAACPGVRTNVSDMSRAANRPGPFLVLKPDDEFEGFLCVPLFTDGENAAERTALIGRKTGPGKGWIGRPSYWDKFQFWIIPTSCFLAASAMEMNPKLRRKRYDLTDLAQIVGDRDQSNSDFQLCKA